jgi:acetyltransferase-like isoleucine patch superfamily enzyme
MATPVNSAAGGRLGKVWRVGWMVVTAFVTESVVFGLSALPAVLFWEWHFRWSLPANWIRIVLLSMSLAPAYLLFVMALMMLSALSVRWLGWRPPANAEMRITDLEWPLLRWARYAMSTHVVRVLAGTLLRATPLWTFYHRLNGARLGRRVVINSVTLSDHNLLAFGDDVVIGAGVHLSGHTVEGGVVKTAPIRLGNNVTIGVGSVIGIGVEIGPNTQVGALSVVPKHRVLEPNAVYGGVPVRRLDSSREG